MAAPRGYQAWRIGTKLILLTVPLIAMASLTAAYLEHVRNQTNLQERLSQRARSLSHQIMADRQYYASVVVPRVKEMGGTLGPDYRETHGRFPLPATFVREVSEATGKLPNGYTINLISPWPINKDKGIRDAFHGDGFAYLRQNPSTQFIRTDTLEGRAVMRVLTADLASAQSCVDCHNAHPQSPKRDYKLNDVMGGLEIVMPMGQYLQESERELTLTLSGGAAMCVLVLLIVATAAKRTITQPLGALAAGMGSFVGEADAPSGGTAARSTGDEVAHITRSFERMRTVIGSQQQELKEANQSLEKRVIERTEELQRTLEEKERIGSELRIASEIQRAILPRTFPPFPERTEFELYADTIPAREMGGDFYDFFLVDQNRLGLVIADVSGKGVPAAIFMAVSRTMLKATAMQGVDAGECLRRVNNLLCPDNDSSMFVTVFYGILHAVTGEMEYANAGHNVPYVLTDEGIAPLEGGGGMALGVMEDNAYPVKRIRLRAGEGVFLYTDGVTEAMDAQGRLFSDERLETLLREERQGTPTELILSTVAAVRQFAAGEPQADDITLLALRYLRSAVQGKGPAGQTHSLTLSNRISELERLAQSLAAFGKAHRLPDQVSQALGLALDEIVTNIISYGYDDQAEHQIHLRLSMQAGEVTVDVEDDGRPFNPLEKATPDVTAPLEERAEGGLGIHLVRTMLDNVEYRRQDGKNRLSLRKRIPG